MKRGLIFFAVALCASGARADCVIGAQEMTKFKVLDNHTLILMNNSPGGILIKSLDFFYSTSSVSVLKDDFCDFESDVLYVDGETVDVQQVKQIH